MDGYILVNTNTLELASAKIEKQSPKYYSLDKMESFNQTEN